jgi:hypothetical protein
MIRCVGVAETSRPKAPGRIEAVTQVHRRNDNTDHDNTDEHRWTGGEPRLPDRIRGNMRRKKGNKFLNAKPGYGHRQMEITREQGQPARPSKNWHTAGLIWRTLARNPEGLFATRSRRNFAGCLRIRRSRSVWGWMRYRHTRLSKRASNGRSHDTSQVLLR